MPDIPPTTNFGIVRVQDDHTSTKIPTINTGFAELDAAGGGFIQIDISGSGDRTLTRTEALNKIFKFVGTLTGVRNILYPVPSSCARKFDVWNATTGAHAVNIKTTAVGSTGPAVTQTKSVSLYHDNTNVKAAGPEV